MCLQEPLRHYIDGTVVLVDLYPQVVTNGGEVVRLRKVPQAVVLHCILAGPLCHSDVSWVSPDSNLIRCAFSAWSRPSHQTSSVLAILQSSVLCDLPYQSSYIFEIFFTTNLSHSSLRAWPDIFISLQHSSCVMLNTGLWLTWERKDEKVSDLKSTYWYQVIHLTQPDPWRWCQLFDISNLQCEALKNV